VRFYPPFFGMISCLRYLWSSVSTFSRTCFTQGWGNNVLLLSATTGSALSDSSPQSGSTWSGIRHFFYLFQITIESLIIVISPCRFFQLKMFSNRYIKKMFTVLSQNFAFGDHLKKIMFSAFPPTGSTRSDALPFPGWKRKKYCLTRSEPKKLNFSMQLKGTAFWKICYRLLVWVL